MANEALLDFRAWLIEQGVPQNIQEVTKNATASKGIYSISSDLSISDYWMLKSMSVNYQDTNQQNYVPVIQMDAANLPAGTSMEWLRANQPKTSPALFISGNSFEIIPAPISTDNVTNFFDIFYFQAPALYTSTSSAMAYPESLDDLVLAYRIAAIHFMRNGSPMYETMQSEYMKRANRIVQIIRQGSQTPFPSQGIPWTGWEF